VSARGEPVTPSGRWKRAHPEAAREANRRSNAKRPHRHRSEMIVCAKCGGPKWARPGSAGKPVTDLCSGCEIQARRERREERRSLIASCWAAGMTLREIAARLDSTVKSVGTDVSTMRRDGWDLPYRYTPERVARITAAGRDSLVAARASVAARRSSSA
jgi:hypothetical protein